MKKMLDIKYDCEEGCLSCGDMKHKTIKININRLKRDDNIVSFHLCKKCLNRLAREFYPFS